MPVPPPEHNPQTWLITGCSRGLGREIALAALARGDKLIATARRQSDLAYLEREPRALILQLDVCEEEESIRSKVEAAIDTFGNIDVLVNNAGFVVAGVWEELR
jgi:NAD(P)-dependent dehydrogenase (short-subunit alcohol dehydrogenase family)